MGSHAGLRHNFALVNEICNAVDFFIKNSAITGQVLAIDSGQNLNWQTPDVIGKE